jgi:hypothetical protein
VLRDDSGNSVRLTLATAPSVASLGHAARSLGVPSGVPRRRDLFLGNAFGRTHAGLQNRQGGVARRLVGSIPAPPRCPILRLLFGRFPARTWRISDGCLIRCRWLKTALRAREPPGKRRACSPGLLRTRPARSPATPPPRRPRTRAARAGLRDPTARSVRRTHPRIRRHRSLRPSQCTPRVPPR